jgi:hypothetical protein
MATRFAQYASAFVPMVQSKMDAQDKGKLVDEIWGDDDYEFWVDVPATAIHKLVFSLLREKYFGRGGAVDEFCAFCTREGVEHQWQSWT